MAHQPDIQSGFRPVGDPTTVARNPWFTVEQQPVDFVDPKTGAVRRSALDGGQMNYLRISRPGVLVVTELGRVATLLMPQERYTTNLVEGRPVRHYELPGGGIDHDQPNDYEAIVAGAKQELNQELGYDADRFVVLGSTHRGLMAHPLITDHNYTVLALGAEPLSAGASPEASEILGAPERFTWEQTEDMSLSEHGLATPTGYKVISSAPTVASLALANAYMRRHSDDGPTYVDLKA